MANGAASLSHILSFFCAFRVSMPLEICRSEERYHILYSEFGLQISGNLLAPELESVITN